MSFNPDKPENNGDHLSRKKLLTKLKSCFSLVLHLVIIKVFVQLIMIRLRNAGSPRRDSLPLYLLIQSFHRNAW